MPSLSIPPTSLSRPGRPSVRTTFQLAAGVGASNDPKDRDDWQESISTCLRWMQRKFPDTLSADVLSGGNFVHDVHGHVVECASVPELGAWAARLQHPDLPSRDSPGVAGRVWSTEIALKQTVEGVRLGIRNACASLPYTDVPVPLSRPGIVLDLSKQLGLHESRPLDGMPWMMTSEADLEKLHALLTDPLRKLPVHFLTQPDLRHVGANIKVLPFLLDPVRLANSTLGLSHVVAMPAELGFKWTERVGKQWSAFQGAVRTYRPGLDFDTESPYSHPCAFIERILFWRHDGYEGEDAFGSFLVNEAMLEAAMKRVDWAELWFLSDVKAKQAEIAKLKAIETVEWRELYEEEVKAVKGRLNEALAESEQFSDDAVSATRESERLRDENRRLRDQNDSLRLHNEFLRNNLTGKEFASVESEATIPTSFDEMDAWAERELVGRLLLHPRASRGIRNAKFEDASVVYRALLLLANEYRDMKMGIEGAKKLFESRLGAIGLGLEPSISKIRAGEEGETYFVNYPLGTARKSFLDLHLTKGGRREERYCLRIYFFWDDENRIPVIGWLPGHLDNRLT